MLWTLQLGLKAVGIRCYYYCRFLYSVVFLHSCHSLFFPIYKPSCAHCLATYILSLSPKGNYIFWNETLIEHSKLINHVEDDNFFPSLSLAISNCLYLQQTSKRSWRIFCQNCLIVLLRLKVSTNPRSYRHIPHMNSVSALPESCYPSVELLLMEDKLHTFPEHTV